MGDDGGGGGDNRGRGSRAFNADKAHVLVYISRNAASEQAVSHESYYTLVYDSRRGRA